MVERLSGQPAPHPADWRSPRTAAAASPPWTDRIGAFRELSMTGITIEECRTAVSVLERMTHNLEPR
ncbi:hypothetical protein [Streptomyces sp. NRRL S-350]|uniref:hypothetical protein n=1 Tax=Streptomyces sp. NRRL S-350 TaxID=1463902 RepID=UPI0004BEA035|nr:hypothetical protein [Streptomyces sp. NRRL S-350]